MYAVDSVEKNSLRSRQGRESSGWEHVGEAIGPGGVRCLVVGAPGGLPAEALGGPPSRYALRWTAFACTQSEGWAHFEFTRINIEPTILHKKMEEQLIVGASCLPTTRYGPGGLHEIISANLSAARSGLSAF